MHRPAAKLALFAKWPVAIDFSTKSAVSVKQKEPGETSVTLVDGGARYLHLPDRGC